MCNIKGEEMSRIRMEPSQHNSISNKKKDNKSRHLSIDFFNFKSLRSQSVGGEGGRREAETGFRIQAAERRGGIEGEGLLETQERGGGKTVSHNFYFFFNGLQVIMATSFYFFFKGLQVKMPKRRRHTGCQRERDFRKRRRRCTSLSPSTGEPNHIEINNHIRSLEMDIHILRAQVKLLLKEVQGLRQRPARGQKQVRSACLIM